jgi:hypothetical protein
MNLRGIPCPKCKRKGLSYADHPHAYGYKDYDKAYCRFCHARFKNVRAFKDGIKREEEA